MDKRITVVLADANEEFRTALKQALEATGEFDVVGCAADGLAAAQDIAERKPQLLVMDLLPFVKSKCTKKQKYFL